jgi:hypothetical protein
MPARAADALLGLLHPLWQLAIAGCLLVVTVVGIRRMAQRGPTRMATAVMVTGALVVAITVAGTLAVSCSQATPRRGSIPDGRP